MNRSKMSCASALFALVFFMLGTGMKASNITYAYDDDGRLIGADYGANRTTSYAYDNAGNLLLRSSPAPGLLPGAVVNGQCTFCWPAFPAGYILQSSPTIGPSAAWADVQGKATPAGNWSRRSTWRHQRAARASC